MATLAPLHIRTFPILSSVTVNTVTDFTQITLQLPEGSKDFKSVWFELQYNDIVTAAGNQNRRQLEIQLGSAGYSVLANNTQTQSQSGENLSARWTFDGTSYFNTNWSGTSMTLDARILLNQSSGTTQGFRDCTLIAYIQYEHDETSATQQKSIFWAFDSNQALLTNSKATFATVPDIEAEFLEDSKVFDEISFIIEGKDGTLAGGEAQLIAELDAAGTTTFGSIEDALLSDRPLRYIYSPSFDTSTTHTLSLWSAITSRFPRLSVKMLVTFRYNVANTTTVTNYVMLPMEFDGQSDSTTSSDYQRAKRDLWIQEPGTITTVNAGLELHYSQNAQATCGVRIGGGSFVTYTDSTAAAHCGGSAMAVNDTASVTLARGRNELQADIYVTSTNNMTNIGGIWHIIYRSDKSTLGINKHNKTVGHAIGVMGADAANKQRKFTAYAPDIVDTEYFFNSVGLNYQYNTANASGVAIGVERLASGEGGLQWEAIYADACEDDPETGHRQSWATARSVFKRWAGDVDANRLDILTARRYRVLLGAAAASFDHLVNYITFHSLTSTWTGDITNSGGGLVTIHLCRASTGERVLTTSRTGNGSYSFTWYDDTELLYTEAYEDGDYKGRSDEAYAVIDT